MVVGSGTTVLLCDSGFAGMLKLEHCMERNIFPESVIHLVELKGQSGRTMVGWSSSGENR